MSTKPKQTHKNRDKRRSSAITELFIGNCLAMLKHIRVRSGRVDHDEYFFIFFLWSMSFYLTECEVVGLDALLGISIFLSPSIAQ